MHVTYRLLQLIYDKNKHCKWANCNLIDIIIQLQFVQFQVQLMFTVPLYLLTRDYVQYNSINYYFRQMRSQDWIG